MTPTLKSELCIKHLLFHILHETITYFCIVLGKSGNINGDEYRLVQAYYDLKSKAALDIHQNG